MLSEGCVVARAPSSPHKILIVAASLARVIFRKPDRTNRMALAFGILIPPDGYPRTHILAFEFAGPLHATPAYRCLIVRPCRFTRQLATLVLRSCEAPLRKRIS